MHLSATCPALPPLIIQLLSSSRTAVTLPAFNSHYPYQPTSIHPGLLVASICSSPPLSLAYIPFSLHTGPLKFFDKSLAYPRPSVQSSVPSISQYHSGITGKWERSYRLQQMLYKHNVYSHEMYQLSFLELYISNLIICAFTPDS